ncbi:hypothetical protein SAMN04488535_0762 [Corynebacterium mycetoides]|uniref:Uncharacterized protein n=1 Tax=Corynebacterium mycetoides TaxID=38302 RepID=A0A1G9MVN8_9CORY|nr:hypothetical protein [Corynebacterium mycetoides]SDL78183.1 hypothetical protein SAMN04488535_0762 [Corynebacterium mycetoides]
MNQSDQLAREERAAASTVDLGATRWVLIAAVVVYLIALFLPFAGGVPGWQILTFTDAAAEVQTKLTEYVFTVMSFIGLAVLTTLVLATRRFPFAAAGWMFTTVSFLVSILAIWLRRTSTAYDLGYHHGPGIYLAILAAGVAVFAYIPVVLRHTDRQAEITQRRLALDERDDVARAQAAATREAVTRENPLLIDDRRARAAERHKKYREE